MKIRLLHKFQNFLKTTNFIYFCFFFFLMFLLNFALLFRNYKFFRSLSIIIHYFLFIKKYIYFFHFYFDEFHCFSETIHFLTLLLIFPIIAGLTEVIIYSSPDDKKKNRGFCFLEYESHKAASLAKRRLGTGRMKVWGCDIIVDWADPQEEPDEQTMSKVSNITLLFSFKLSSKFCRN